MHFVGLLACSMLENNRFPLLNVFKIYPFGYLANVPVYIISSNEQERDRKREKKNETTVNQNEWHSLASILQFRIVNIIHWGAAGFHDDCVMYMFVLLSHSTFFLARRWAFVLFQCFGCLRAPFMSAYVQFSFIAGISRVFSPLPFSNTVERREKKTNIFCRLFSTKTPQDMPSF